MRKHGTLVRAHLRLVVPGIVLACAVAAPGYAAVSCGDTVTTVETMTADLVCGANDPAFTIAGGSVDMQGHRVSGCLGDGIVVTGSTSTLSNGSVSGCGNGIRVEGVGFHTITDVVARQNTLNGFVVTSDANTIRGTAAADNDGTG